MPEANPNTLTILRAPGKTLTKSYVRKPGGKVARRSYDSATHFIPQTKTVAGLRDLASFLDSLNATSAAHEFCIIRGEYQGDDLAKALESERMDRVADGSTLARDRIDIYREAKPKIAVVRRKALFHDVPRAWVTFDFDNYKAEGMPDWRSDPEGAVSFAVERELGPEFAGVDFHYRFSSSAGFKDGLSVHVWFWLAEAMDGLDWKAWFAHRKSVLGRRPDVDVALTRTVQIHYVIAPRFNGVQDPLARSNIARSGTVNGLMGDCVEGLPKAAPETRRKVDVDHTDDWGDSDVSAFKRPGIVGAFNRAWPVSRAIQEHLADAFEIMDFDGEEGRVTFLLGSGGAGGCRIFDHDTKLYNSHKSDPFENRPASAFDLIQQFMFDGDHARAAEWASNQAGVALELVHDEFEEIDEADRDIDAEQFDFYALLVRIESASSMDALLGDAMKAGRRFIKDHNAAKGAKLDAIVDVMMQRASKLGGKLSKGAAKEELKRTVAAERADDAEDEIFTDKIDMLAHKVMDTRFASGKHLLYSNGAFWIYRDGYWQDVERSLIEKYAYVAAKDEMRRAQDEGESPIADTAVELVNAIINALRAERAEEFSVFRVTDDDRNIINCRNVELHLQPDGQIVVRDHNPGSYLLSRTDAAFDPDAQCPEIDAMMNRIFGYIKDPAERQRVIDTVWELLGYAIQGNKKVPVWILFKGPGKNGKTQLTILLRRMIGDSVMLAKQIEDFGDKANPHVWAGLVGKRLLVDDDVNKNTVLPDGPLKKMCETKLLTANPKHQREFNFISRVTPILLANGDPQTRDLSEGMMRRAIIVSLLTVFSDEGANAWSVGDVSEQEISGALNRALAGWKRFVARQWAFDFPLTLREAKEDWIAAANNVAGFIRERLQADPAAEVVPAKAVYKSYRAYVREQNGQPIGLRRFYDVLRERGVPVKSGLELGDLGQPARSYVTGWKLLAGDNDFDVLA